MKPKHPKDAAFVTRGLTECRLHRRRVEKKIEAQQAAIDAIVAIQRADRRAKMSGELSQQVFRMQAFQEILEETLEREAALVERRKRS